MRRRTFVRTAGGALGAAALSATGLDAASFPGSRPASPPGARSSSARVAVVGAGAFGGWTALHLAERGADVTLVDAYGPGNARATSGGDSRGLRFAYGEQELYTRWAVSALGRWEARQEEWGTELMVATGRLSLVPEVGEELRATRATLDRSGAASEILDPEEIHRRWPQIVLDGVGGALYEPEATAIRANLACREVARAVARAGGAVRTGRALPPVEGATGRLTRLELSDGGHLEADIFLFACGSWLPRLFPRLLGDRIDVPRRDVFFFGPPAGDSRFSHPNLPNFSEAGRSVYGFPDFDGVGFKVAPFGGNDPFDPDSDERIVAAHWLRRARAYLALRFPDMAGQPLVHGRVCQLENAPGGDFLVDRHPEIENVWIAGGGSGHGFKHGPVLGDYLAGRILGEDPEPDLAGRFRIVRP